MVCYNNNCHIYYSEKKMGVSGFLRNYTAGD